MMKCLIALLLAALLSLNLSACKPRTKAPVQPKPPAQEEEVLPQETEQPQASKPVRPLTPVEKDPTAEKAKYIPLSERKYPESEAGKKQKAFDEFIMRDFVDSLQEDYLALHYTLLEPEVYGIDSSQAAVSLGDVVNDEYLEEARNANYEIKKEFEDFDYDLLTPEQQETYLVYEYLLEMALLSVEGDFPYMGWAFSPMQGLQGDIVSMLMEFEFYTAEDVDAYMELMADVPRYIDEMLDFTYEQEQKGYFMPDVAAEQTISYCDGIVKAGEDSSLLEAVLYNIDHCDLLTESQKADYKENAHQLFMEGILPAYQKICEYLEYFIDDENNQLGLAHLENGKEYYEFLFRQKSGSDLTVEEGKALLEKYLELSWDKIGELSRTRPEAYREYIYGNSTNTGYTNLDEILSDLEEKITQDFPYIEPVDYTVSYLDSEVAIENVGAYYVSPPLDSTHTQKIKVNPENENVQFDQPFAFTLLAHEGMPGHLYQTNYMMQNVTEPFRQNVSIVGYTEGWASYMELIALGYLEDRLSADAILLEQCYTVFENCLYALCDIGIHYEGWDEDDLEWFLDDYLSIQNTDPIFEQLVGDPAAFQAYYMSCIQLIDLRRQAQNSLGGRFDLKEFHEVLLSGGDVPFTVLKQKTENYIESKK